MVPPPPPASFADLYQQLWSWLLIQLLSQPASQPLWHGSSTWAFKRVEEVQVNGNLFFHYTLQASRHGPRSRGGDIIKSAVKCCCCCCCCKVDRIFVNKKLESISPAASCIESFLLSSQASLSQPEWIYRSTCDSPPPPPPLELFIYRFVNSRNDRIVVWI